MRKLFLLALALALATGAPAFAAGADGQTIFQQSAPHTAQFLGQALQESRGKAMQSALSLLEGERPAVRRFNVITHGGILKVEALRETRDSTL